MGEAGVLGEHVSGGNEPSLGIMAKLERRAICGK
jgi:hypothetical protein